MLGKTVGGRFRLIQRLGSGGMSSVYLARHILIDRLMAIKALRRDLSRDPVQRDRFLREARAVNRINHENIVEISDFGETEDGLVYLVMEYVPGEPLQKVLGQGSVSTARALDIVEQCASALGRAHQMGVIHRDLKPENILIVRRKERRDFVKLLDFGIAKILDAPSLTGSQQIFGTPGYIAPEYIQSNEIDGRADLYSLGCILYEMVTGALPFDYEYPGDLLVKHVTEEPVPPRSRRSTVEPALEDFILRSLAKDPERRFRDAFHFRRELRAVRERLGPDTSWGGLDEARPTFAEASSSLELGGATAPYGLHARDTTRVTAPARSAASGLSAPTVTVPRSEPPSALGEALPALALAGDVDERTGASRWRRRFDVLLHEIAELEKRFATPADVAHAMRSAATALEELEDSLVSAQAYQQALEAVTERARDFRSTLGRAIDDVAGRLSAERDVFEALAKRRTSLRVQREAARVKLKSGATSEGEADALLWELAAVEEELRGVGAACDRFESRRVELSAELAAHNEQFDAERARLMRVLDAQMLRLEASAQALQPALARGEAYVRERTEPWLG